MLRMLLVLTLCMLTLGAQAAVAINLIEAGVPGGASFNSDTIKIASNQNGTIYAYVRTRNTAYTAQNLRIVLYSGDSETELLSEVAATSPACVEASDTGEFFAAFPNWVTNKLTLLRWPDVTVSTVPERVVISLGGDGKYSCVFDENRRLFYYLGLNGTLILWNIDTGGTAQRQLFTNGVNPAQYPYLALSPDGALHVFWNTLTGSNVHYRGVQYMVTPNNGNDWYTNWAALSTYAKTLLTLPLGADENGGSFSMSRTEDLAANTLLISGLADDDTFAAVWLYVPGFAEQCLSNIWRCTSILMQYDRHTFARKQLVPMRSGHHVVRPQGGGALLRRADNILFLTTEGDAINLYRVDTHDLTLLQTQIIPGAAGRCAYALSAERGASSDQEINAMFVLLSVTCAQWAAGGGFDLGDLYRVHVTLPMN